MKVAPNNETAPLLSGDMETVDIGISDNHEDQLMILNVLSNTLYTDKISAVLREYGTNAVDANVEADKGSTPIKVRLPNRLDPTVAIRDYGFGMTKEQILQTFCKLGRSTKRSSNAYTGMLGIGSKAGFAYGDSFTVTSHAQGIKTIYGCVRQNGKPTLSEMHSEKTTEPDGVEIKVPVRQQDIYEFVQKAERVFRYFKVRPQIVGADVTLATKAPEYSGAGWRYVGDGKSVAIMGNVGYDLDYNVMGAQSALTKLIQAGVELDFNIGDLEIAANREGLQYRDHTKNAVLAKLRAAAQELGQQWSTKLAGATSLWEAKALYHDMFVNTTNYLTDVLAGNIVWRGQPITSGQVKLQDGSPWMTGMPHPWGVSMVEYHKDRSYRKLQIRRDMEHINASSTHTLCINDMHKIVPSRVNGWFHTYPTAERLTIFTFTSKAKQDAYWKHFLDGAPCVLQSTITPYVAPIGAGGNTSSPSAHRNKHSRKAFTLREQKPYTPYDARSTWWDTTEVNIKDDAGVYVTLDAFWVQKSGQPAISPEDFRVAVVALRGAGLITGPVYGFKRDKADKLGKKWKRLEVSLQEQMDKLATKQFLQWWADYDEFAKYETWIDHKWLRKFPGATPIAALLREVKRMANPPKHKEAIVLLNRDNCTPWLERPSGRMPPTICLADLTTKMLTSYPMIRLIGRGDTCNYGDTKIDQLVEYVKLVENS